MGNPRKENPARGRQGIMEMSLKEDVGGNVDHGGADCSEDGPNNVDFSKLMFRPISLKEVEICWRKRCALESVPRKMPSSR